MKATRLMLWLAAVVAAVGVTTAAVTLAGASDNNKILSQDDVSRQLSDISGTPTADATRSPDPGTTDDSGATPSADGAVTKTLFSDAAQITARCDGDMARLESWSPNPGYRVDEVLRGPAPEAYLWIESDIYEDVTVYIRCEAGEPTVTEEVEQDDHGRNRGRG